jgi:gliding motility associated protien GldN
MTVTTISRPLLSLGTTGPGIRGTANIFMIHQKKSSMHKRICTLAALVLLSITAMAQQPVPSNTVREANVLFSKRQWRIIDLREKQNKRATWPGNPLPKILYESVRTGKLRPYKSDSLRSMYNLESFMRLGTDTEFVETPTDPNDPSITKMDTIVNGFIPEERIKLILVMEDWYFDQKLSTMIPRIIAIAPLYKNKVAGIDLGLQPLCWLRYEDRRDRENDCRDVMVKEFMFNAQNAQSKFSYDDWFQQRLFNSYVIKTSNVHDISIMQDPEVKKKGIEALIEAERIRRQTYEQDANMFEE